MKPKFRKAVFIVTYRKSNSGLVYLVLKRKLHWKGLEFPKGGIERFEFKKRAVKRELFEETGQISDNIKKYPIKGKYKYHKILKDRADFRGQSFKLYSAEIKNKRVIFDKKEHSTYKWVNFRIAMKLLKWQNQRKCLSIVNNYLTSN
jgi:8-oxo-dGTP pyrophosphatase MutT (NUDIX family)